MFASSCSWLQNFPHSVPFDFKFPFSSSASTGDAVPLSGSTRPCLTSLPPSFSLQSAPFHPFFRLYMHLYRDSHCSCAYHVLPLSPPCSLPPPPFLTHFSVMHPFSVLHSCCKMTPPPSSHLHALSLAFVSYHAGLIFFFSSHRNGVSRFVCVGRTWRGESCSYVLLGSCFHWLIQSDPVML